MNLWQGAVTALDSLRANKLRSALTVLGIVIGVAAVISLVSIGRGARAFITSQIQSMGTNLVFVRPGSAQQGGVGGAAGSAPTLTEEDAAALSGLAAVTGIAPEITGRAQLAYLGHNMNTRAVGVTADYLVVRNMIMADGEFVSDANVVAHSSVVVLGSAVANTLFGGAGGSVGQTVRVNGQPYRVVGVLASKGGSGFGNQDDQVLVPLSAAQSRLLGGARFRGANVVGTINVQISSADEVPAAIISITETLRARHGTAEGSDDFIVQNQQDTLATITQVTNVLTIFLSGIAAISLLVGGIGIMNIMLVSVTERTREIGIRKAVGARGRDILYQFLVEAAVLSLLGGLIGVALGWAIAQLVGRVQLGGSAIVPVVGLDAVLLAAGFSTAIGLFFGIYPASRAANLEPVDALRYE
ncbi:MAG: ABC transporter permease [Chloroflexi bacterium]|nr:MAG: ABC transporter permease [Chloroflexota bacterium]RLT53857.1 MAG: ABC transporter permease [Chloroflexota bacterium]